ncbi:MAG: A/G-specific adenine glycosylase [Deltaproteobacteria bacterium]|nr:A/G-specific adenine glycosylase [Deltaproteobacteria bacterium]
MTHNTQICHDPGRDLRKIRAPLLRWYDVNRRDLPWRRTADPYAIWISETMLQQTRVDTVIPYWERFLETFPDVASLAAADIDEVYAVWTGLGYYSRARNLKAAAETVVADCDGRLPNGAEGLRQLKGIGRYTAGAIASIAFDREEPLVDGNVVRVFTRLIGIREDCSTRPVVESLWAMAAALVRGKRPGDLNQALMELGATLCTPRKPDCGACPLQRHCDAHAEGDAEELPIKKKKPKKKPMRAVAAWIERSGRILAVRRPEEGLMAGLWELPGGEIGPTQKARDRVAGVLRTAVGLEIRKVEPIGQIEHLFSHRCLALEVFRCLPEPGGRVRRKGFVAHRWLRPDALLELAHAGPTRKAMTLFGVTTEASARAAGGAKP